MSVARAVPFVNTAWSTCAATTGRFLQPGDQVVGAIERLGELPFEMK